MKKLSLGYSPCPNDTFIFYALIHGKVSSRLSFAEILEDVETLNRMALSSKLDVTKASFHALGVLREKYGLLRSGGALGKGCGPLIVSKENYGPGDLEGKTIAIPGKLTTAFLLLQIFNPALKEFIKVMPFHEIIDAVSQGTADAGLIIHESRFTYEKAGLKKVLDLGEWWEEKTGLLLPLGGILARRDLGRGVIRETEGLIRKSVEYALSNRSEPLAYIRGHSQEMEEEVVQKHISLYVNDYSIDLGPEGCRAAQELFRLAEEQGVIEKSSKSLFVD